MTRPRYLEQVILGEERGKLSWLIRALLWPLSMVYRAGLAAYLAAYSVGLRKRRRLKVPVISVGNLTFGGTGKTPAVQTICRILLDRGKQVAVLSRGHGGSARGTVVVSDGHSIASDSRESGDEPMLLAMTLPGVPIVVGKDRRKSAQLACERFDPDVIVLDDGLQYWQLYRELDVVILDAARPFGSGFVMPAGDLREPIGGLRRAGIVLLANARELDEPAYSRVVRRVSQLAPNALVFRCAHEPTCFKRAADGQILALDWVKGRRIVAFSGIARPASFADMLESLGASLEKNLAFPDHHAYTGNDIGLIDLQRKSCRAEAAVTTEKDLARLGPRAAIEDLYALAVKLEIEESSRFADRINSTDKAASAKKTAD